MVTKLIWCCLFLWGTCAVDVKRHHKTFNPDRDGIVGSTDKMALVMKLGHPDMRALQEELDAIQLEEEIEDAEMFGSGEGDDGEDSSRKKRFLMNRKSKRWIHGIIPYKFMNDMKSRSIVNIQTHVFPTYEYWTHFRFVEWNESVPELYELDHTNHLIFVDGKGCYSLVGNMREHGQKISCCTGKICMHEIAHALGFFHEQKSPYRDDYVRINWENIIPKKKVNFRKFTIFDNKAMFGYYDMNSIMAYHSLSFTKNWQETITVLDPDMVYMLHLRDNKDFYLFYEAQSAYHMKHTKCPDFPIRCMNDGYVSYVEDSCRCRCPVGLDHRTGCSTHIGADIWPHGSYSLLRGPGKQCPSGFQHGKIMMSGDFRHTDEATLHFCTKMYETHPKYEPGWFDGNYCVFVSGRFNATCPPGFEHTGATFNNAGSRDFTTKGYVPQLLPSRSVTIATCCRKNWNANVADGDRKAAAIKHDNDDIMTMPSDAPVILLKQETTGQDSCMDVNGMDVLGLPRQWTLGERSKSLTMCMYKPVPADTNDRCGNFIHMSPTHNHTVIATPDFPSLYSSSKPCTWFLKGPEQSIMLMDFSFFEVVDSKEQQYCQSYVEIRYMLPGQPGLKYCGQQFKKTIVTHGNTLGITVGNMQLGTVYKARFKTSVRIILESQLCYTNRGLDNSYQGTVNYGHDFEPCIHWDKASKCRHHLFNHTTVDLESNYCRNPGHGTSPWCYTNAETCSRVYCDVCKLRKCYDIFNDCESSIKADPDYCMKGPEAFRGCRDSCGRCEDYERNTHAAKTKCSKPKRMSGNAFLRQLAPKPKYYLGDKVSYTCGDRRTPGTAVDEVNSTCTSEGEWTDVSRACLTTCRNKRLDCDLLLLRNPIMCYDHPSFSTRNCAETCGLCGSSDTLAAAMEDSGSVGRTLAGCHQNTSVNNATELSDAPYREGDLIAYECLQGYNHVSGDLKRACLPNGVITGSPPVCISQKDMLTKLFNAELRKRLKASRKGRTYTISHPSMRVTMEGMIERWDYYSMFGGIAMFDVWRQLGNESRFLLAGSNTIDQSHDDRLVRVPVPKSERIAVKPGDFIGVRVPYRNHAGIAMDLCRAEYNPEGSELWQLKKNIKYEVGKEYPLSDKTDRCFIFSLEAVISASTESDPKIIGDVVSIVEHGLDWMKDLSKKAGR